MTLLTYSHGHLIYSQRDIFFHLEYDWFKLVDECTRKEKLDFERFIHLLETSLLRVIKRIVSNEHMANEFNIHKTIHVTVGLM
jgi:hypothetical protein